MVVQSAGFTYHEADVTSSNLHSFIVWRPTSPENDDVLICINAPFMIQHVLKPWWLWTYQNSVVKRASARAVPIWVTFWKVWFRRVKNGQYYIIESESLHFVRTCKKKKKKWSVFLYWAAAQVIICEHFEIQVKGSLMTSWSVFQLVGGSFGSRWTGLMSKKVKNGL